MSIFSSIGSLATHGLSESKAVSGITKETGAAEHEFSSLSSGSNLLGSGSNVLEEAAPHAKLISGLNTATNLFTVGTIGVTAFSAIRNLIQAHELESQAQQPSAAEETPAE